ncbi:MAG: SDR family oxidoreductase [Nocardiopsaceae bacterium]|jgi:NAD(P)-dependent dehydrogenase (short-subunit alcohol dehydrogenase family)|nr:SDR family oxidoreductase [Nocardiopsaceae bacterium]
MSAQRALTDLFGLTGRRAAIVGGTGVLGSQFARCLASAGAEVIVVGRSRGRGATVVHEIEEQGGRARAVVADVTKRMEVERLAADLDGTGGIDILINAAGENSGGSFADISESRWAHMLEINLNAVFRVCQAFIPQMSNRDGGASIINISSASSGPPLSRVAGYAAAKAGVNNLTQYLAGELATAGIRVNAVVPGFFPAEQNRALLTPERMEAILDHTPMRRLGTPAELDGVIIWLAAPRASGFVTGTLVHVDGGFSAMSI